MKMFSIIVPIYKIENYIEECINSVLNQKYNNYELILVDDGSPDKSGEICDKYSSKNNNIVVIHKKNGGLSDARNAGIDISKGKYIMFLDGDDVLSNNALINISNILANNEVDLLIGDFNIYGKRENCDSCVNIQRKIKNINDFMKVVNELPWSAWRNVYKASVLKGSKLTFKKGLVGAEDCDFFMRFIEKTESILYTDIKIVDYRLNREGSITNNISFNAIIGQLDVFSKYFNIYYDKQNSQIYEYFAMKYLNTISTICNIKDKEKLNKVIKNIKENKKVFKFTKGMKYNIAKIIWNLLGYYNGSKFLNLLKR